MTNSVFNKIIIFCFFIFVFLSCTTVHDDRIRIFCMVTDDSSGVAISTSDSIEFKATTGSFIDLEKLKFPKITYNGSPEYGYKSGNKTFLLNSAVINGTKAYFFKIDATDDIWDTTKPLPFSNLSLFPMYEQVNVEIQDEDKPGVQVTFYTNDLSGKVVKKVKKHYYTSTELASETINLSNVLSGHMQAVYLISSGELRLYDTDGSQDRLFYGYVDTDDNNHAYFYNSIQLNPGDTATTFMMKDDKGSLYSPLTPLDKNSFTNLTLCYTDAGYRPKKDNFGIYSVEGFPSQPLSLDMVFVPGSYTHPWPYEYYGFQVGDTINLSKIDACANDQLTDGMQFSTQDMLVMDINVPIDFLKNLLKSSQYVIALVNGNGKINVQVSDNEVVNYVFDSDGYFSSNFTGATGFDSDLRPATGMSYKNAVVLSNILTHLYNLANPDKQLSYAYLISAAPGSLPVRDVSSFGDSANYFNAIFKDPNATGYRLLKLHEFSYISKIITDERQLPSASESEYPIDYPQRSLILYKEMLGTKHSFKSVNDGNSSWYGSSAGLALYSRALGSYTSQIRYGYQGMNRSNSTQVYSSPFPQKMGYNWQDSSTNSGYLDVDYNTRNGCGMWGLYGNASTILDNAMTITDGSTYKPIYRGGAYSCSPSLTSNYYNRLRLKYSYDTPLDNYSCSVRLCRNVF